MSTDETRPEDAANEQGGPADARPVGPDPAAPVTDPAAGPTAGPAPADPGQQPYPESGFYASIRRGLFPRSDQRWVGGVAGGVAERIGWDPLLVRGILIVSFFLGGLGLILYGIGWALLPERDGRIHLQEAFRGNFDVAMLGSVAVFLTGFAWGGPLGWWGDGSDFFQLLTILFWLAAVGVVLYVIVQGVQRQRDLNSRRRAGTYPGAAPGTQAGPGTPGAPGTPNGPGAPAPFTPAPKVDYHRNEGLVYATGAGPAPRPAPQPAPHQPYQQPQYQQQAPHRSGPVAGSPRPVYTPPPRPVRTRRGPGATAVGVTLGVILLAGALLLAAERLDVGFLVGEVELVAAWLGITTVALGIAIFVSGLRGRTSGVLGFFAIVSLLFGTAYVAVALPYGNSWADDAVSRGQQIEELVTSSDYPDAARITEGTVAVDSVREAEDGFYVRWGEPTIDLSELDVSKVEPGNPIVVPIGLGAGQATVIVPQDAAVEANAYVAAGVVQWNIDNQDSVASAVDTDNYFASDEVGDEGAVISLEIEAGAGEVVVSESK